MNTSLVSLTSLIAVLCLILLPAPVLPAVHALVVQPQVHPLLEELTTHVALELYSVGNDGVLQRGVEPLPVRGQVVTVLRAHSKGSRQ